MIQRRKLIHPTRTTRHGVSIATQAERVTIVQHRSYGRRKQQVNNVAVRIRERSDH